MNNSVDVGDQRDGTQRRTDLLVKQLTHEGLGPCVEQGKKCGIGRSTWTWIRWCVNGVRGVRLEAVQVGSRWETSVPAIRRFLAATNNLSSADATPPRSRRQRTPSAQENYLEAIGLGRGNKGANRESE